MKDGGAACRRPGLVRAWTVGLAALVEFAVPVAAAAGSPLAGPNWCIEVRRGESLAAVARRAGTSVDRLGRQNALRRGEMVRLGDILALPALANGNAAPAHGPHRSSHLTGASVDLSKVEHSESELRWLRLVLRRLARRGVVSPIEEFVQPTST